MPRPSTSPPLQQHFLAALYCGATAAVAKPIAHYVDPANVVMLFLLVVFLIARRYGRGPALTASFLSVGLFDFFFVPPSLSLAVDDIQYLITFAVMLTVAIITGQLVARLGLQAEEARARERRTRALYDMASQLAGAITLKQVEEITQTFLRKASGFGARLLVPDRAGRLGYIDSHAASPLSLALPERAFAQGEAVENLGLTGHGTRELYLPLKAPVRTRGVMEVAGAVADLTHERALLDTVSNLVAIALERLHYAEVAQTTEVEITGERLRSSVLASLSHDLRTPLTAMVGLAETLTLANDEMPAAQRDTARALHEQAVELADMVNNLLDLARLASGGMILRKEWQPLEEVIGAAIKRLGAALAAHQVRVDLPPDFPLLEFDSVLLERVIGNLLDNASKHAPAGSAIAVSATANDGTAQIRVCDEGSGFPAGVDLQAPFLRDSADSGRPAVGLGLTICKAIVEAHQGTMRLCSPPHGQGACVCITLPLGTPPVVEEETPEDAA